MTSDELLATIKKQPIGVSCGVICLILAGLLYVRGGKISEYQVEFAAKSAEATKILANVRNADKLAAQVAEIQALSKEMDSRMVRAGQLAVNLQYFYKLEAETEVKLLDVRQGNLPKVGKSLYAGIPFSVSVQGSFKQVISFLQKLENGPYFCRFSTVNFSKAVASAEAARAGADVTGTTLSINLEVLGVP
jgi:Tfp pilus assembly protein PilO